MADDFAGRSRPYPAVATKHRTITPSDTQNASTDLRLTGTFWPFTLRCTVAGNLAFIDDTGVTITYPSLVVGEHVDFRPVYVLATGTTATVVGWG